MSVPHSGTRTLVEHLGQQVDLRAQGLRNGRWWHFGSHESDLAAVKKGKVHIPIRHPLDVAQSWARRTAAGKRVGNGKAAMIRRYNLMFAFIEGKRLPIEYHKMENLPVLAGAGEHDGDDSLTLEYQAAVGEYVIEPHRRFFMSFYG